jgi:curved DNA-binding protein CbpA
MTDYYKILGIKREASAAEIKQAYRTCAKSMHPDVNTSTSANKEFALINEAYGVLSDPDKKRKYDIRLAYGDYFLVNSVFTHNGNRAHKTHRDPRRPEHHGGHEQDKGYTAKKHTYRKDYTYGQDNYSFNKTIDPMIYNLFFAAGMFIGFLMIFLTIAFVYIRMWPYAFLLMTIPGFILVKEGWKGIARIKKSRKNRMKK